jgi:hypothetical protein
VVPYLRLPVGIDACRIKLEEPRRVDATGGDGYVVVPAAMSFALQGKQVTDWLGLYRGTSQGLRRLASNGLGMGKVTASA